MDPDLVRQQFDEEANARRASNSTVATPALDAPQAGTSNVVPLIIARTMSSLQGANALAVSPAPEPIPVAAGRTSSLFASSALAATAWTLASLAAILGFEALRGSLGQMTPMLAFLVALALGVGLTLDPLMKCEKLTAAQALTLAGVGGSLSYALTLTAFAAAARDTGFPVPGGAYGLNVAVNACAALVLVACATAAMLRMFEASR